MFLNHSEQRLGRKNRVSLNKKNYLNTELVEGRDGVRVSMLKIQTMRGPAQIYDFRTRHTKQDIFLRKKISHRSKPKLKKTDHTGSRLGPKTVPKHFFFVVYRFRHHSSLENRLFTAR